MVEIYTIHIIISTQLSISIHKLVTSNSCLNREHIESVSKQQIQSIKMALMTMIARVVDGLPLVGTMQDDEQVSPMISQYIETVILIDNHFLMFFSFQRFLFSPAKVCWNIRIRPNYCSANWAFIHRRAVPLKLAHICSSKFVKQISNVFKWSLLMSFRLRSLFFLFAVFSSKMKFAIWFCVIECIPSGWPLIIWKIWHKNFNRATDEK